ncbi:complement factor H-like isoform X1 [Sardina pilchardus]|uniref:complement factor H-like isoform X1 n=1 Tax=Sardina pilchardus TaxID=27697 RepID=UPI002E0F7C72
MLHATMKTTLLLFCSLVCVATNASETDLDKVCTEPLPAVDNAEVLEEYRGDNYTHGSVLPFTCRLGYVSAGRTMYSCSNAKWVRVRKGKCVPRPCELPEDIPNGKYDLVDGTDLVFGATIKYTCDEGYQMMSRFHTRVCMVDGWSNSLPVCEAVACLSEDNPSLIVRGLPEDDTPITYGHKLQFECADSGMVIRGEQEVTCTSAGQWNHPFPRCEVVTCELERTYSSVNVRGLPANGGPVKYGTTLYFTCAQDGMTIKGTREVTCTSTGEWSAPFPKCEVITCAREEIHTNVHVRGLPTGNSPVVYGTKLDFRCTHSAMVLHGAREVTCLDNGRWSNMFPRCEKPPLPNGSCGPPPPVAFGSIVQGLKTVYSHDDWVKFQCPYYYILKGRTWYPSWMRCNEGKWENESMKCLRPCTVTSEDMDKRNIQFQYPRGDLRYVKHDDHVTFMCKPGTMNRKAQFGQYCNNGHMDLPICYKYNY